MQFARFFGHSNADHVRDAELLLGVHRLVRILLLLQLVVVVAAGGFGLAGFRGNLLLLLHGWILNIRILICNGVAGFAWNFFLLDGVACN